jgi:hypothetical protein
MATFEEINFDDEVDGGEEGSKNKPDDLAGVMVGVFGLANLKLLFILFLLYIFVNCDMFIDKILGKVDGAVADGRMPTTKGTVIAGLILVLLFVIADVLVRYGLI